MARSKKYSFPCTNVSLRHQGIQKWEKNQTELAKGKRSLKVFFSSPVSWVFFVQTFGIISPKKNKTEISTIGLFPFLSLLLSFHPEQVHTSELCFRHSAPTWAEPLAPAKLTLKLQHIQEPGAVLLPRDLPGYNATQDRKTGPFSQGTYNLNAFNLINL